ncbi:MAG: PD-(D/E)XK nuclease family protein [Mesorhizobium sp.]|uniref:PD-(D/E)XK nuclease family protein n=1 Tax=Mesorhizobium sp. TaxID=1871066 RepID=UPI000FE66D4A|nr:PD-(D/E)XK nuclease family protein [Mesorhizobium sp.]RWH52859.1 MAG: PD-(D/E)XK nuclease family protein [Mesorhizobium sp.]
MATAILRAQAQSERFRTVVVDGPLALRMARLKAARAGAVGLQIMTLPQLAARLVGGFVRPAHRKELEPALAEALAEGGFAELTPLQGLPGTVRALVQTFERLWSAGVDLASAGPAPRLSDLALIERRVRTRLGPGVLTSPDLAAAALARARLAADLLGPVDFEHIVWVAPVWRSLVAALGEVTAVTGLPSDGPGGAPAVVTAWVCADPHSEVVEALRWARELIATGRARPEEIAIAAAAPGPWDESMQTLVASSELPVHFSHGMPILSTVEGQACAALAELLGRGLSQERVRRWLAHSAGRCAGLEALPEHPLAGIQGQAHLNDLAHWRPALDLAQARRTDGARPALVLLPALELVSQGWAAAEEAGQRLLPAAAVRVWRAAMRAGPPEALAFSLAALRTADGADPGNSVVWCPAAHLAGAPRRFVRLIGLTAGGWPRGLSSDPLVPDHILSLDNDQAPTRPQADRRAFASIVRYAENLSLSYSRRNARGGLQTSSPLLPANLTPVRLARQRIPEHAFSAADRLAARADEARQNPRIARATGCWQARRSADANAHDGLIQADHPVVIRALGQAQSATSLRRLLRDPQGFVWRYALGWRATVVTDQAPDLDPRAFGDLVHLLLQRAVSALEQGPGFGRASANELEVALGEARDAVLVDWPLEHPAPPPLLWRYTLDQARMVALRALRLDPSFETGTRSWTEVRFGDPDGPGATLGAPWDSREIVPVPGTPLTIRGAIDRLELDNGDRRARVTDYKTGAVPKAPKDLRLGGGAELQRVLYAVAVAHHRPETRIQARLVYLAEEAPQPYMLRGDDLDQALADAVQHLNAGVTLVRAGTCLPGPNDPWEDWNELRIALPAIGESFTKIKDAAFRRAFGDFAAVWRAR